MKKKYAIYALVFTLVICLIKIIDITMRYDINLIDYIKYSLPLSEQEKTYLKENRITYGINAADAPFSFSTTATAQNKGIIVDYFNQLSVSLECDFHPVVFDRYGLGIELSRNNIDCSVLNKNRINNRIFHFTQTLYKERNKILVSGAYPYGAIREVKKMKVAVISGSTAHHAANEYFAGNNKMELVLASGLDACFNLLADGDVDGIIGNEAEISYHLNQALRANRYKFLEEVVSEEDVAVAVNKDQNVLFSILNKGILEMKKNNQYNHIHSKWFGSFIPETEESRDSGRTANVAILLIIALLGLFLWNKAVSEQVAAKTRELNESRNELYELVDSLADGIAIYCKGGAILSANRSFAKILDMEVVQVLGKNINDLEKLEKFLQRSNNTEPFLYEGRYYLVYQREINSVSKDSLIVVKDYTERYKYEQLNTQEAKMIAVGELSAGLAHEIRNPLGIIRAYLFLLSERITSKDGKEAVAAMEESIERINALIENLLGFSRVSSDKRKSVDISNAIERMIELKSKDIDKKAIKVNVFFESAVTSKIKLNEDVLNLCMLNILGNAVDAFENTDKANREIDIRIKRYEKNLEITVSDNGCGMSEDVLNVVFNPFYTTKEKGTGLGLYMVQSELRKIGGEIRVTSDVGIGTSFYTTIPIEGSDEIDKSQE